MSPVGGRNRHCCLSSTTSILRISLKLSNGYFFALKVLNRYFWKWTDETEISLTFETMKRIQNIYCLISVQKQPAKEYGYFFLLNPTIRGYIFAKVLIKEGFFLSFFFFGCLRGIYTTSGRWFWCCLTGCHSVKQLWHIFPKSCNSVTWGIYHFLDVSRFHVVSGLQFFALHRRNIKGL